MENLWLPIRKIITNEYKKTWPVIGIYWQYLLGIHDMVFGLWSYETSHSDSLFGGLDLQFGQSHGGLHPLDRSRRRVWIEAEAKPQCWRSVDTWAVARHLIYSDILSGIISGIPSGIYSDIISGTRGWSPVVPPASIYIWHIYSDILLAFYLTSILTFFLAPAVEVQCPVRSGAGGVRQYDLALAVPAAPTEIRNSQLRPREVGRCKDPEKISIIFQISQISHYFASQNPGTLPQQKRWILTNPCLSWFLTRPTMV